MPWLERENVWLYGSGKLTLSALNAFKSPYGRCCGIPVVGGFRGRSVLRGFGKQKGKRGFCIPVLTGKAAQQLDRLKMGFLRNAAKRFSGNNGHLRGLTLAAGTGTELRFKEHFLPGNNRHVAAMEPIFNTTA